MMIPILLGVTVIVFTIMSFTPGDPARLILGQAAPQEAVDQLHHEMGLDDPFVVRYIRYIGDALHGDFGHPIGQAGQYLKRFLPGSLLRLHWQLPVFSW